MRRFRRYLSSILSGLLFACTVSVYPTYPESDSIVLESIQVQPASEGASIEIRSNKPFDFVTYTLTDPDRLVIDPVESSIDSSLPETNSFNAGLIRSWSLFRAGEAGAKGAVDYLSFTLNRPCEHLLESTAGALIVHVRPIVLANSELEVSNQEIPPQALRVPQLPTSESPSDPPFKDTPLDAGSWSLDAVMDFGLSHYRPVQVAREEIELAQMKLREARRALYPAATLKTSWTTGTASNVDFREASHGVQIEHPLYYSGRLIDTYRQALVNLQVSEKRGSKVKADFSLEIAQAYFQYIGAKVALNTQEGLVGEVTEFLEKAKARFDEGLLTRLEMLNVEAQANQAKFQRVNAENDLVLARLKFLQRLGLGPDAVIEAPSQFPPYVPSSIDLEEVMKLSIQYRPDIQVNSLLVEFHEYEERISKEKGKLKIDLSGFIGASGAAFETEPLNLKKDYFVGVKATQAWGPHGATTSFTDTHTSPRLGQTTRTDSAVYSGELGILNQLQGLSEIQQARIGLEKARADLEESKMSVFQEVQEAYLSYTKARLQLEYAKQKIAFRQEQVKILQAQASVNEALPSQVLEATLRLTEEEVAQAQALTSYHVALSKLNKAIGLPRYYR